MFISPEIINNGDRMYVVKIDSDKGEALCLLKDYSEIWVLFDELRVDTEFPDGLGSDLPFAK